MTFIATFNPNLKYIIQKYEQQVYEISSNTKRREMKTKMEMEMEIKKGQRKQLKSYQHRSPTTLTL